MRCGTDGGSQSRALGRGQRNTAPKARRSLYHWTIPRRTTARGAKPNTSRLRVAMLLCSRATACRYAKSLTVLCSWQCNCEFPWENPNLCPPHPVLITTSLPDSDRPPDHDAHELHSTRRIESRCKYRKTPILKAVCNRQWTERTFILFPGGRKRVSKYWILRVPDPRPTAVSAINQPQQQGWPCFACREDWVAWPACLRR